MGKRRQSEEEKCIKINNRRTCHEYSVKATIARISGFSPIMRSPREHMGDMTIYAYVYEMIGTENNSIHPGKPLLLVSEIPIGCPNARLIRHEQMTLDDKHLSGQDAKQGYTITGKKVKPSEEYKFDCVSWYLHCYKPSDHDSDIPTTTYFKLHNFAYDVGLYYDIISLSSKEHGIVLIPRAYYFNVFKLQEFSSGEPKFHVEFNSEYLYLLNKWLNDNHVDWNETFPS